MTSTHSRPLPVDALQDSANMAGMPRPSTLVLALTALVIVYVGRARANRSAASNDVRPGAPVVAARGPPRRFTPRRPWGARTARRPHTRGVLRRSADDALPFAIGRATSTMRPRDPRPQRTQIEPIAVAMARARGRSQTRMHQPATGWCSTIHVVLRHAGSVAGRRSFARRATGHDLRRRLPCCALRAWIP